MSSFEVHADEHADVLIVGAGPAGCATALFLQHARPDLRIVVLERERFPREKICGGAIGGRADQRLAEIGVSVSVPSVIVDGMHVSIAEGAATRRLGSVGRVVRRIEFDAALAATVRARGVRLLEGCRVLAVERRDDAVLVRAEGRTFAAEAIVGADGVGSIVRRALGLSFGGLRAQAVEIDTDRAPGDPPIDCLHFDLRDRSLRGYAWDFPTIVDGELKICRGVYRLGIDGDDPGELLERRLRAQGLAPGGARKRFAERGFELHRACSAPRTLLVGEAAGIDPVTGEGIAQAIEYGAVAGRYLADCLARRNLRFADWPLRVRASALGVDMLARSALLPFAYGALRPSLERFLIEAPWVMDLTMGAFAGKTPRIESAARTGLSFATHGTRELVRWARA